jgi:ABC-2 type transport system permease protein
MHTLLNIFHLGVKELRSLGRDTMMLVIIAFAFSGQIYIVATGIPESLHLAPIAIVDEDHSQLSQRLVNAFYPPRFLVPDIIDPSATDPGMDVGLYTFVLDIPPDFQRDVLAGRQPTIQVNVDATRMTQAFIGNSYIHVIVNDEVKEFVKRHRAATVLPVEPEVRVLFNPNLSSVWFGSVMELINSITALSLILTGAALIREREHGTIEHLLVMPLTPFEIMMSKVWSMGLVVVVVATASIVFIVQGWLEVPIQGSIALFVLGMALHLFATTSLGILLGTMARSMPQTGTVDGHHPAAAADAVRRHHPVREHARLGAEAHAGGADHPFRRARPGHSLPRGRHHDRLAAVLCPARHRQRLLRSGTEPLPQDHRYDGLMGSRYRNSV